MTFDAIYQKRHRPPPCAHTMEAIDKKYRPKDEPQEELECSNCGDGGWEEEVTGPSTWRWVVCPACLNPKRLAPP